MVTRNLLPAEAAEYLGGKVTVDTLRYWRFARKGPRYRKLPNGKVTYSESDLDKFSEAHVVDPLVRERAA